MKRLSILRHAKAAPSAGYAQDFDRPLTPRGIHDVHLIAPVLARLDPPVQWMIASSAQRTRETAQHVLEHIPLRRPVLYQDAVYNAHAEDVLHVVAAAPSEVDHLLIVGHNPSMERTAAALCSASTNDIRPAINLNMPTGGLAHLELNIAGWDEIKWGCGALLFLLRPKLLRDE